MLIIKTTFGFVKLIIIIKLRKNAETNKFQSDHKRISKMRDVVVTLFLVFCYLCYCSRFGEIAQRQMLSFQLEKLNVEIKEPASELYLLFRPCCTLALEKNVSYLFSIYSLSLYLYLFPDDSPKSSKKMEFVFILLFCCLLLCVYIIHSLKCMQ